MKGWWRAYGVGNYGYIALEHEAQKVCDFQMGYIPGLLQTPAYTRRVFETASKLHSRKTIERAIEIRRLRQDRLTSDNPLVYQALLYEPMLHHGCNEAQLRRLITVAELPNVTIQIVPASGDLCDLLGSFTIFSFEDKDEPDIAYTEHLLGMAQTDETEKVAAVRLSFQSILKHALSPEDSIALIKGLMT